jgi:hypothetical protein
MKRITVIATLTLTIVIATTGKTDSRSFIEPECEFKAVV